MIKRILKALNRWEEYTLFALMISMLTILVVQVFCRYLLSFSFSWAEQAARIGFVWLTMVGISLAAKKGLHLKVDLLNQILPHQYSKYITRFSNAITILFGIMMGWLIFKTVLMQFRLNQVFSSIPWLPTWTMYIAGTIGMLGLSIRTIQRLVLDSKSSNSEEGGK